MAFRPVKTNELRAKHRMSYVQVFTILKKAKVKPIEKIDMGGRGIGFLWPNREANAALRAYREEKPAKRMHGAAPKKQTNVRSFTAYRENKQIEALTDRIDALTKQVAKLAAMWEPMRKTG